MRVALVILYFAILYYILSPVSAPDLADTAGLAESTVPLVPRRAEPSPAANADVPMPAVAEAQAAIHASPAPPMSAAASLPAEVLSVQPGGPSRTGAVETPGEERTSVHAAPGPEETGADIRRLVQKELVRLACLSGNPDRKWGKKSRAALRRFADRAKPKQLGDPDPALLRMLRGYPQNYCKLCKPGQTACYIEATGSLPQRSEHEPRQKTPAATGSYLPPWMQGDRLAEAEDALVQSDATETADSPEPEVKKPRRRRAAARPSSLRQATPARGGWESAISGWPRGR
jgi:hypothetical protein